MNNRPHLRPATLSEFGVRSVTVPQATDRPSDWLRFQAEFLLEPSRVDRRRMRALLNGCAYQRYAFTPNTIEFHSEAAPGTSAYAQPLKGEGLWDVRNRLEGVLLGTGEDACCDTVPDADEHADAEDDAVIPTDIIRVDHLAVSAAYHRTENIGRLLLGDLRDRVRKNLLRYAYAVEREEGEWDLLREQGFRQLLSHYTPAGERFLVFDDGRCPWLV